MFYAPFSGNSVNFMNIKKDTYSLELDLESGEIKTLVCAFDRDKNNAVMTDGAGGFGRLVYTSSDDNGEILNRYANKGQSLILKDFYEGFSLLSEDKNSLNFENNRYDSTLKYTFLDDSFTVALNCGKTDKFGSFGLSLDINLIDTGVGEDYNNQYIPAFPYESENGKTKLMALRRPDGIWILFLALSECAGWRIVYEVGSPHILRGFQFLKAIDERFGGQRPKDNELRVRVSFHKSLDEIINTVENVTGIKIPQSVCYGGAVGERLYFNAGESGALKLPDGGSVETDGSFVMKSKGIYSLTLKSGGTAEYFCYESLKDLFLRATDAICEPYHCDFNLCEGAMWLWSLLIRKRLFESAGKNEYRFKEFVKDNTCVSRETVSDNDIGKIVSFPHSFEGKDYSKYHLYKLNRIQNAVTQAEVMLEAWRAYKNADYLNLSKEYLSNLIRDHLSESGALCCDCCGDTNIDYTTVTVLIFGFVDLYRELLSLGDSDAEKYREASIKIADHLVRRGFDFPTEGTGGRKEMEEGSISCTALSLLYAYRFVCKKEEYLSFANELLLLHDAWTLYTPQVSQHYSTVRWWEANWEGDGDGSSINAGHAWTIWKAEANYHYAYITGNFDRLIRSYNGYLTSFSKVRADGRMYTCFTPDYLPSKPFKIKHSYPDLTDGSMPYYVWPRSVETWFISSAVYCDENGTHCLNGALESINGILHLKTAALFLKRLFIGGVSEDVVIKTEAPLEIVCDKNASIAANGKIPSGICELIAPINGRIIISKI